MSVTVNVNGLSLCHKGSGGVSMATIPDVCKTPSPGGPVPIPYPNVAKSSDLAKGTTSVKADGGKMCANYGSEFSLSVGDEPGTAGGVKSSTFKKEASWITYSFDVKLEGKGACRLTDKMFHNHQNTVNMGGVLQAPLEVQPQLEVLCQVFCRCARFPVRSASGQSDLRQECVKQTLDALGGPACDQSPFRAEISYNMTTRPPAPFMSGAAGRTLCRSRYWQGRAQEEIEDYVGGQGMVRRPDVVIVRNAAAPPVQSNLAAVVEMKFPGDSPRPGQIAAYERIAGGDANRVVVLDENECDCRRRREQEQEQEAPARVPAPSSQSRNVLLGVGLLVAAAALILTPVPGDEVAAGAAGLAALGLQF